jgi:glycosyltransferase involved in cell wall biosynthesis
MSGVKSDKTRVQATRRVTAYVQLRRAQISPTGVGKHVIQMVRGLSEQPGFAVTVAGSNREMNEQGQLRNDSPLSGLKAVALPGSTQGIERWWRAVKWPAVERWAGESDWVYCPAESYVPTKRARLAVTVHDLHALETDLPWSDTPRHRFFRLKWQSLMSPIVRHASLLLAVSEFTKRRLTEFLHVDPSRIVVVGNGVEDVFFEEPSESFQQGQRDEKNIPRVPEEPFVLVVGGLTMRKGGDLALAVARELERARSPLQILVAGHGEQLLHARAKMCSNVTLLGYVSEPALRSLLRQSVSLLFLSRYEGFGIPVLEAMASGTAVVCSRAAALPEVVGSAGLLVDATDAPAVAALLRDLSGDDATRQRLIAAGRVRASAYRWSACVSRLAAALR